MELEKINQELLGISNGISWKGAGYDARFRGMSLPAQVMFMAGRIRLWIG